MTDRSTRVRISSAWLSKINWTQAVAFIAMLATVFGIDLDPKTQVEIISVIQGIQSITTWAMRTWWTTSITPASM